MENEFIGQNIQDYIITEFIGAGFVGSVYKAENQELADERAIKLIPIEKLVEKKHWEQEIIKVNKLHRSVARVVPYHAQGEIEVNGKTYKYIMWDYIPSQSLRQVIEAGHITMQIVLDVVEQSLTVFHACKSVSDCENPSPGRDGL